MRMKNGDSRSGGKHPLVHGQREPALRLRADVQRAVRHLQNRDLGRCGRAHVQVAGRRRRLLSSTVTAPGRRFHEFVMVFILYDWRAIKILQLRVKRLFLILLIFQYVTV